MLSTAVAQVIAIHACHHHILQAHVGHGGGQAGRLVCIRRLGPAMRHITERAAPRAHLAQDHEGRGAVAEALVDVRAAGFLADRDQAVFAQLGLEVLHCIAGRNPHPDPRRLAQHRRIDELHRRAVDLVATDLLDAGLQRRRCGGVAGDDLQGDGTGDRLGHGNNGRSGRKRKVGQRGDRLQDETELARQLIEQHRLDGVHPGGAAQV